MSREEKVNLRIKFNMRQAALFAAIFGIVAVGVLGYLAYGHYFKPVYTADFNGETLAFRENLREAQKVEVVPSEADLRGQMVRLPQSVNEQGQLVFRRPITNVTIVFKSLPTSETMGWYTVEASEIIKKLTSFYKGKHNLDVNYAIAETDDYDDLVGSNTAPIIALVHPQLADGTFVEVDSERNVVTISGGDSLRDFDLATVKFLMATLGIEV